MNSLTFWLNKTLLCYKKKVLKVTGEGYQFRIRILSIHSHRTCYFNSTPPVWTNQSQTMEGRSNTTHHLKCHSYLAFGIQRKRVEDSANWMFSLSRMSVLSSEITFWMCGTWATTSLTLLKELANDHVPIMLHLHSKLWYDNILVNMVQTKCPFASFSIFPSCRE